MNKSQSSGLCLIPFFCFFWVLTLLLRPEVRVYNDATRFRIPASGLSEAGCRSLAQDFLGSIGQPAWKQFFEGRRDFNFALYREKAAEFKMHIQGKDLGDALAEVTPPNRAEEVMAFLDALNETYRQSDITKVAELPRRSRKKLQKLAKKMASEKRVVWRDLESVVSEIYELNLGPRIQTKDFFNSELLKQRLMTRVFQEDLAQKGLKGVFKKYRIFADRPHIINDFMKSKKGEALKTSLFNLPMFFGAPPLYLPRLRPMRLSKELADDILLNGFGPEQMAKFDESVRIGPLGVSGQARYEILRKAYMLGATVYLSAAAMYEAYETDQVLDEEREVLNQIEEDVSSDLNQALELEDRGYAIFEDSAQKGPRDPRCRLLESCFEQQNLARPYTEHSESTAYKQCKKTLDRNNRCDIY